MPDIYTMKIALKTSILSKLRRLWRLDYEDQDDGKKDKKNQDDAKNDENHQDDVRVSLEIWRSLMIIKNGWQGMDFVKDLYISNKDELDFS